jgi:signal transduction histidine kinase
MPTGGTITLETQYRNGQMEIRFSDTGTGIAPELAEVIFEPFETSKPTGSGLGLYIVREVVSAHGGEVQIESIPGQGTTVIVVIPASGFYGTEKSSSGENLTGSENNG